LFIYDDMTSVNIKSTTATCMATKLYRQFWPNTSNGYAIGRQCCTPHTTESSGFIKQPIRYIQQKLLRSVLCAVTW